MSTPTRSRSGARAGAQTDRSRSTRGTSRPRRTLGLRRRTMVLLVLLVVVCLAAAAWFSPLLVVRSITVRGTDVLTRAQVVSALEVGEGTRLLPLDTSAAAERVLSALPRAATVRVTRSLPSGLTVAVTERTAVAWVRENGAQHLVDSNGVDFATAVPPPGLPELTGVPGGAASAGGRAALNVLDSLPAPLRSQVLSVSAATPDAVTLTLTNDRRLVWGSTVDSPRKAAVALALLTQPAKTYDVSSPDLPTTS
ncbi:MAG: FtsQ-type POTRA domain-containing protein [Mycobacteriaceae bacterium]